MKSKMNEMMRSFILKCEKTKARLIAMAVAKIERGLCFFILLKKQLSILATANHIV